MQEDNRSVYRELLVEVASELVYEQEKGEMFLSAFLGCCHTERRTKAVISILEEIELEFTPADVVKIITNDIPLLLEFAFKQDVELINDKSLAQIAILRESWDCLKILIKKGVTLPSVSDIHPDWVPSDVEALAYLKSIGIDIDVEECGTVFTEGAWKGRKCDNLVRKGNKFCEDCTKIQRGTPKERKIEIRVIRVSLYTHKGPSLYRILSCGVVCRIPRENTFIPLFVDEKDDGNTREITASEKSNLEFLGIDC